jgi:catechol 2,3-dioxygenase-like lactoylglutathione lyase family enzyme
MGVLASAKPAIVVCTRDRERSAAFYRDTLGLTPVRQDALAAVFDAGGTQLRISTVPDFTPHGHTVLGFVVPDVSAAVRALIEAGVVFQRLPGVGHDELGVLTLPGGQVHVAWLQDPDGNLLSITDAP